VYSIEGSGRKTARKKPLGKPRREWKSNIKKCHPVNDGSGVKWICLAQDRDQVVGFCERGDEPSCCIKCWEICDWLKKG
jgi:hypothetical protein